MIRVLVAEDHTIVREGIKQLIGLAKDLLVVGEASNGEQLLETLRHVPCEVVLLDISMPGVNGLEAIPRIRALNNPPAILVLSMHDEAQMAARALEGRRRRLRHQGQRSGPAADGDPQSRGGRALHRPGPGRPHGVRSRPDRFAALAFLAVGA